MGIEGSEGADGLLRERRLQWEPPRCTFGKAALGLQPFERMLMGRLLGIAAVVVDATKLF